MAKSNFEEVNHEFIIILLFLVLWCSLGVSIFAPLILIPIQVLEIVPTENVTTVISILADIGQLLVSTGLLFVTYRIVQANRESVQELRNHTEIIERPFITIQAYVKPGTSLLYLSIKNTGKSAAYNLKLAIDRDFYRLGNVTKDYNLASYPAFNKGIPCFAPNAELKFYLATSQQLFGKDNNPDITPSQFQIIADYESTNNNAYHESIDLDLEVFLQSVNDEDNFKKLLDSFERIREKGLDVKLQK